MRRSDVFYLDATLLQRRGPRSFLRAFFSLTGSYVHRTDARFLRNGAGVRWPEEGSVRVNDLGPIKAENYPHALTPLPLRPHRRRRLIAGGLCLVVVVVALVVAL